MVFIMILLVGAFLIFSNQMNPEGAGERTPSSAGTSGSPANDGDRQSKPDSRSGSVFGKSESVARDSNRKTTKGDWAIEEVGSSSAKSASGSSEPKKTTKGDWAIEEVGASNGAKADEVRLSNSSKTQKASTKKSDWAIEEVDQPKKTKKGDWEIEEVNKKK